MVWEKCLKNFSEIDYRRQIEMYDFFKKTKIVVTLGPASETYEQIKELALNGANVFRLNTSHGNIESHSQKIDIVNRVSKDLGLFLATIVDLQGPKIRVGNLFKEIELKNGDELIFSPSKEQIAQNIIPVDYEGMPDDVEVGEKVLLDDGKIQVKVLKIEGKKIFASVTNGGILKSRKGINIPGAQNSLETVSERDKEFIKFAIEKNADYIALSFVRNSKDVEIAQRYIKDFGGNIPIISKIEKPQAMDNIVEIINVSDAIMVARGDLGIELSPVEVPICQKIIIEEANKQRKPVIVATQMLESMIEQPIPTRAESSDVANAIIDGADAVMLSGETSVGKFAALAVKTMEEIAHNTEISSFCPYNIHMGISDKYNLTRQAVVNSTLKMAEDMHAKAIVSFSHTGYSSRLMAKQRPDIPIIIISDMESTCRRLNLYWNTYTYCRPWDILPGPKLLEMLDEFLIDEIKLQDDDYVVFSGSMPMLISGRTNFVRVHRIGAIKEEHYVY